MTERERQYKITRMKNCPISDTDRTISDKRSSLMKKINASVLVIDDQEEVLIAARLFLKRHFNEVTTLSNPANIIKTISEKNVGVVLLDMNFRYGYENGKEGIYWMKEIAQIFPDVKIILMTSYADVHTAVEGIKLGAVDYLLKPWENDKLLEIIKHAVKLVRKQSKAATITVDYFTGQSEAILKAYKTAERIAKTDVTTLILGENGTGKFVLAKYIHDQSIRRNQPFVHVDLGSLNENLFESELFGYVKGAFTDAHQDCMGRFEKANTGTIFLDEIGNVPLHLQSKLLQVIQNKEVIRLGESKPRPLDVRIITATNENLQQSVIDRRFREDLYYRINTVSIEIPPLRERREDIIPLLDYFIHYMSHKYGLPEKKVDATIMKKLELYKWSGNIRELQNRVERAVVLAEGDHITLYDMGFSDLDIKMDDKNIAVTLSDVEKNKIQECLIMNDNNISRTAEQLGISRAALYRKMEKYNISNT